MYFWNVNALVCEIGAGQLRRADKAASVMIMLLVALLCWSGLYDDRYDATTNGLLIAATQLMAIYLGYCANSHVDGRDFGARLLCIGVPVAVRVFCVFMPVVVFASLPPDIWRDVLGRAGQGMAFIEELPDVMILAIGTLVWGWRVSVHISRIRVMTSSQALLDMLDGDDTLLATRAMDSAGVARA